METLLATLDEAIMDYLLYRGFVSSFRTMADEKKRDVIFGLNVDRLCDHVFSLVQSFDMDALLSLWSFLDARFFCHLEEPMSSGVREIELSLKHYFMVNCMRAGKGELVVDFFKANADNLLSRRGGLGAGGDMDDGDWRKWFALPFLSHPEDDVFFAPYFTVEWAEALGLSLHNMLTAVLHNLPPPKVSDRRRDVVGRGGCPVVGEHDIALCCRRERERERQMVQRRSESGSKARKSRAREQTLAHYV